MPRYQKYNILCIGPLPPPKGGDTLSFTRILSSIQKDDLLRIKVIDTCLKSGVRTLESPLSLRDILHYIKSLIYIFLETPFHSSILLCANARFITVLSPFIIIWAKLCNKQILLKPFGSNIDQYITHSNPITRLLLKYTLNKADKILPQTKHLLQWIDLNTNRSNCYWFPNYIIPPDITPDIIPDRDIIFLGQVKKEKGIYYLIEFLKNHPQYTGDIYGPIIDKEKDTFLDLVNQYPNIRYCGEIENSDAIPTIQKYKSLVLPSYFENEGHPAVILEAMNAKRPVIATKWNAIPELISHKETGYLVKPKDYESLSNGINALLKSESLQKHIVTNAHQFSQKFTEESLINKKLIPMLKQQF